MGTIISIVISLVTLTTTPDAKYYTSATTDITATSDSNTGNGTENCVVGSDTEGM